MVTESAEVASSGLPATVRALAARWAHDRQQEIADQMTESILAGMASVRGDEELARLTRGTCRAIVDLVLTMMEHGIPAARTEAPVVAIEHARMVADRGGAIEDLLRYYRLGHACFTQVWADAMTELAHDPAELLSAVRQTDAFVFTLVDEICSRVSAAYLEQRERLNRRTAAIRRDVVRAVLDGEPVEIARAERSLGHCLREPQLAFICWTDGEIATLEHAATAMQDALSVHRPLMLPSDDRALSGWFAIPREAAGRVPRLADAAASTAPSTHVALGPMLPGLDGFRRSRACAERVRTLITTSGRPAPTVTQWSTVALAAALSVDIDGARELVRTELGALVQPGDHTEALRQTAHAFVVGGFSYATVAADLYIHRNTALQRVKRAEALRGKALTDRPGELLAALALVEALGTAPFSEPTGVRPICLHVQRGD